MNILVTGSSGFVGYHISKNMLDHKLVGLDVIPVESRLYHRQYCGSILDLELIPKIIHEQKIATIIHAAAIKDLSYCESNKDTTTHINVAGTDLLRKIANEHKVKMIYISSDQVFDGAKGNYDEASLRNPINYYGQTKAMCESRLESQANIAICRTAMVFGEIPLSQEGVFEKLSSSPDLIVQGYIVQHVLQRLKEGNEINLAYNEFMNPTSGELLARQLQQVLEQDVKGILHCCGGERISRYEFGLKIARVFGYSYDLINPIMGNNLLRPKDVSLQFLETERKLGFKFDTIETMLQKMKEKK